MNNQLKPQYCQYCGRRLDERCGCLREIAEYQEEMIDELENRQETLFGWCQQDLIDQHKFER